MAQLMGPGRGGGGPDSERLGARRLSTVQEPLRGASLEAAELGADPADLAGLGGGGGWGERTQLERSPCGPTDQPMLSPGGEGVAARDQPSAEHGGGAEPGLVPTTLLSGNTWMCGEGGGLAPADDGPCVSAALQAPRPSLQERSSVPLPALGTQERRVKARKAEPDAPGLAATQGPLLAALSLPLPRPASGSGAPPPPVATVALSAAPPPAPALATAGAQRPSRSHLGAGGPEARSCGQGAAEPAACGPARLGPSALTRGLAFVLGLTPHDEGGADPHGGARLPPVPPRASLGVCPRMPAPLLRLAEPSPDPAEGAHAAALGMHGGAALHQGPGGGDAGGPTSPGPAQILKREGTRSRFGGAAAAGGSAEQPFVDVGPSLAAARPRTSPLLMGVRNGSRTHGSGPGLFGALVLPPGWGPGAASSGAASSGAESVRQHQMEGRPCSAALAPPPPPPRPLLSDVERLLAGVDGWQFDCFALQEASQGHGLSCLAWYLLQREGLIDHFQLRPAQLAR
jgi:hypothetical protein